MIVGSNYRYLKDKSFSSNEQESRPEERCLYRSSCRCIETLELIVELKAEHEAIQRSQAMTLRQIKSLSDDIKDVKFQLRYSTK